MDKRCDFYGVICVNRLGQVLAKELLARGANRGAAGSPMEGHMTPRCCDSQRQARELRVQLPGASTMFSSQGADVAFFLSVNTMSEAV